jgi:pyruvate/2-oxoglutarate dehydrogenase complex dihydrolipoamide acyltransferase (E2) component
MTRRLLVVCCTFALFGACDSGEKAPAAPAPGPAKGAPAAKGAPPAAKAAAPAPDTAKAPAPPKPSAYDQTKKLDWKLTPARRTKIEAGIAEAKGFVDGTAIVDEIIAKKIKTKEERTKLFLQKAKGKWIYLAAQTNPNPFNANASLNLIFGEGGLMPDFMMVQLTAPKGFVPARYEAKWGSRTGYITAFVGKLADKPDLTLDPVHDVYLPGYLD